MKNKKGDIMSSRTTGIIIIAVSAVVLFSLAGGINLLSKLFFGKASCVINAAFGGGGECMHRLNLDMYNLSTQRRKAIDTINIWYSNDRFKSTAPYFRNNWKSAYRENDPLPYEYLIDQKIAEEFRYCKDISESYDFRKYWKSQEYTKTADTEEDALGLLDEIGFTRPPMLCVICSRIKFDDELKELFSGKEIGSLNEWMMNREAVNRISFYEYSLFEGKDELATPIYKYSTAEPYAVVYFMINKLGLRWFFNTRVGRGLTYYTTFTGLRIPKTAESDIKSITLMPFSQVSRECDFPFS
jgi:hypothetical protein